MKPSALPHLVCISCKNDLHLEVADFVPVDTVEKIEILTGSLTCKVCLKQFLITGGIPRLVDKQLSSSVDLNTGDRFADAWKEFSRLDERYRQQFFDWIFPVDPDYVTGKTVLEAGVGKGRHAQLIADSGADKVFGIDIGNAIDVAYQNVGHLPKLHLVQSDIRQLPFKNIFDFAFSVGVLHHMEDPQAGFTSLSRCLKDDGSIAVWVYGKENNWWITNLVSPVREAVTTKLPAPALKGISTTLSIPVYLISKFIASPYSELRKGAKFLPELFYEAYLSYIARFDFTEVNHIVFDHLIAPVAFYVPREEVLTWFLEAGFTNPVVRWHNKNSWTGFASHRLHDLETMRERNEEKLLTLGSR